MLICHLYCVNSLVLTKNTGLGLWVRMHFSFFIYLLFLKLFIVGNDSVCDDIVDECHA